MSRNTPNNTTIKTAQADAIFAAVAPVLDYLYFRFYHTDEKKIHLRAGVGNAKEAEYGLMNDKAAYQQKIKAVFDAVEAILKIPDDANDRSEKINTTLNTLRKNLAVAISDWSNPNEETSTRSSGIFKRTRETISKAAASNSAASNNTVVDFKSYKTTTNKFALLDIYLRRQIRQSIFTRGTARQKLAAWHAVRDLLLSNSLTEKQAVDLLVKGEVTVGSDIKTLESYGQNLTALGKHRLFNLGDTASARLARGALEAKDYQAPTAST